jgi:hypothetical protein
MAELHVMHALRNKRAELAGTLIQLEQQLVRQRADLTSALPHHSGLSSFRGSFGRLGIRTTTSVGSIVPLQRGGEA